VLTPNKTLSTHLPKGLRALHLTFKKTGNAQQKQKLDLSK
jgi:hypothetical protein